MLRYGHSVNVSPIFLFNPYQNEPVGRWFWKLLLIIPFFFHTQQQDSYSWISWWMYLNSIIKFEHREKLSEDQFGSEASGKAAGLIWEEKETPSRAESWRERERPRCRSFPCAISVSIPKAGPPHLLLSKLGCYWKWKKMEKSQFVRWAAGRTDLLLLWAVQSNPGHTTRHFVYRSLMGLKQCGVT